MKRLLFCRRPEVYLPEIPAYCAYLKRFPHAVEAVDSGTLAAGYREADFDVVWRFMGLDRVRLPPHCELVHEYGSLSTGSHPRLRDRIKRWVNVAPQRRVFLNETVQRGFAFNDDLPFHLRDMGVDSAFFISRRSPEYDYVYAGSLYRPGVLPYLQTLVETSPDRRFLLIGAVNESERLRLGRHGNVVWTGRVNYAEVPALLASARFALNIVPDLYPYNCQTATKVLEYCAVGLPVLSTRYAWVESFAHARTATFGWLPPRADGAALKALENTPFLTPEVSDLEWQRVIERSGVFEFLGLEGHGEAARR